MRGLLREMHQVCVQSIGILRDKLRDIKDDSINDRQILQQNLAEIASTWDRLNNEVREESTTRIHRLTVDHDTEVRVLRSQMNSHEQTIEILRSEIIDLKKLNCSATLEHDKNKSKLETVIAELQEQLVQSENNLAEANAEKMRAVNETRETMTRSHKTEIESLRSRFKLMTNMERSPSDTSLENIDRSECSEAPQFDIEYVQTTQPQASPKIMLSHSPKSPSKSSSDIYRQILFTKDQELEALRQQYQSLEAQNKHIFEQCSAMQPFADVDTVSIRNELNTLREELILERSRRQQVEESFSKR